MGHSWEGITSLDPWVTHGKILRSLYLLKMLIESQRSTLEPTSREGFTLVTTHMIRGSRYMKNHVFTIRLYDGNMDFITRMFV